MKNKFYLLLIILISIVINLQAQTSPVIPVPQSQYFKKDITVGGKLFGPGTAGKFLFKSSDGSYIGQDITTDKILGLQTIIDNQSAYIKTLQNANAALRKYVDSLGISVSVMYSNADFVTAFHNQYLMENSGGYFAPTTISFGNGITATSIPIILAQVTNATSYQIWRSTTGLDNSYALLTTLTTTLTYTDSGLNPNTTYYYQVKASDGTKYSTAVVGNATTLANLSNNSLASAGYTVKNYIDFSDLTGKSSPTAKQSIVRGSNEIDSDDGNGNFLALYSTDGDVIQVVNGRFTMPNINNLKLYTTPVFASNKIYKITLYNVNTDFSGFFGFGNSGAQDGKILNGNYTATLQGSGDNNGYIFLYNGSPLSFTAFKLEVQN